MSPEFVFLDDFYIPPGLKHLVAEFIDPRVGDKVNSGIGLLYVPIAEFMDLLRES